MLLIDTAEPAEIERLLSQSVPVARRSLNQSSKADYYFFGEDGRSRQWCRVQAGELLGNVDSQEDELRRYYESADISNLVTEGLISSTPLGRKRQSISAVRGDYTSIRRQARPKAMYTYKVTEYGFIYDEREWDVSPSLYFAWLDALDDAGIRSYNTVNYVETAKLLVASYKRAQKTEHKTLNRYYHPSIPGQKKEVLIDGRPRIVIVPQDPFVKALMGLSYAYQLDIGEVKAKALSDRFHNIAGICLADVTEVMACAGIGRTIATKLLRALGREE